MPDPRDQDLRTVSSSIRPGTRPRISVAVSTYNRETLLARLLDSLADQSLAPEEYEVIVVDNGSSDGTSDVLVERPGEPPLQLLGLRIERNRGPAVARNEAWRRARAEIVAFTDDDCVPASDWLAAGCRAMDGRNAVVVGRTLPDPSVSLGPFSRTMHVEDVNWLPTCNVFYRRDDLEAVGGFDEHFPTPSGEDTDLAYRVRSMRQRRFRFEPTAIVHHDVRRSRFLEAARETARWVGIPRFFKLHPDARERIHRRVFWKPAHPKVIIGAIGATLSLRRRWWALLLAPWLYHRIFERRPPGTRAQWLRALPGVFALDLIEVATMVRGSIRERTWLL